jgi:hypothetical protein
LQAETGEIFGRAALCNIIPAVKAYRGLISVSGRGIEFTTAVAPHWDPHPTLVRWLIDTPGVRLVEDGIVAIRVQIIRNIQA